MESEQELLILVDDNPTNLMNGINVLSEKYNVFTAPSAKKMFALLEKHRPDLILLDIEMPEMNGYEAIKILKEKDETRDIPVIFLTGKTETNDELDGLTLGAIDYITKPFVPSLLLKRIEVHLLVESQKRTMESQKQKLEVQQRELQYYNDNLKKAFSTYVSGDVVQDVMSDPSRLQLGGSKRNMTAIFTDIQGFTSAAEILDPEDLVRLLNVYLSGMSDIIMEEKGTIDKYEGDAIMAFFGAPLDLPDHARRACTSAVLMKYKEREINAYLIEKKISPVPLFTRIGINTGDMVVGNMGSERKMNYTIMGNAVNLASRLEGVNKQYGSRILVTEETLKAAGDGFLTRRLDTVRVMGVVTPVQIHELLDTAESASVEIQKLVESFNHARDIFENRDWAAAEAAFEGVLKGDPNDGPARLFLERARAFGQKPPETDWDGVFNLSEK
ncbi:putative adenylate cyclase 2 (ATP pyrophosphate-lyase 2) (Adenylylcyclase 2) (AC2) [Treponema primitia ZAS-2]|uniref:Putative adenylate cyclase 2 (ATP pyrophosphate-lyase 2) (Adenylylcyclase 2) (AC2) n=1 Tax=Treponema primitia (strain ATCC BAA-887 / DSM 12427 / ZAS-2) TaxID=545694 RepID=F5YRH2_TREPZ|nr:adenylate/guanylate cyclase domain-containing protein [Treponema primitia]AEF85176.1 putative adenylate cyclase 2 (ATP pyrophosphate-lyase 2) (Adenylylcyclase 2) (AC2) [Treponema primitia ZAS-2]